MDMNAPYLGEWPGERNEGLLKRRYDLHRQFSGAERNYVTMKDSLFRRNGQPASSLTAASLSPAPVKKACPSRNRGMKRWLWIWGVA